jgi:serine/threonine protein kinase
MKALQDYLKIAQLILPDDEEMNRPTICHKDLSPNNVLVDKGNITGLIDWQHCKVLPLFMQAMIPSHFQNFGDEDSEYFRTPRLPPGFDSLSNEEKQDEEERYRRRQLHFFYLGATSHHNFRHYSALCFDVHAYQMRLFATAGSPWEGDNTSLRAQLIRVVLNWSKIRSTKLSEPDCPISYSEQEVEECLYMDAAQKKAAGNVGALQDFLGVQIDGWVPNEAYETIKETAENIKSQMIAEADSDADKKDIEDNWPFQDHEEIE